MSNPTLLVCAVLLAAACFNDPGDTPAEPGTTTGAWPPADGAHGSESGAEGDPGASSTSAADAGSGGTTRAEEGSTGASDAEGESSTGSDTGTTGASCGAWEPCGPCCATCHVWQSSEGERRACVPQCALDSDCPAPPGGTAAAQCRPQGWCLLYCGLGAECPPAWQCVDGYCAPA